MIKQNSKTSLVLMILFVGLVASFYFFEVKAETTEEIKQKIDKRSSDIAVLEKEIANYQKQIDSLSSQASSLQSTLKTLQLTKQKLEKNIALTQDKITSKNYEIQKLDNQISNKKGDIQDSQRIIAKTFATMNEQGQQSVPYIVLGSRSVSDVIDSVEQLNTLQQSLYERIEKLNKDKTSLESNKKASESAKAELLKLNNQLSNERALVLSTVNEQTDLLRETNQSEANYKKLLATKREEALAFQREINDFENQLKIVVDQKLLPKIGSGVLSWPLDNVFITQKYGRTDFSVANKQFYKTGVHNGMDFRAALGTPVKAAKSGIVAGVGNTDVVRSCKSYGRWVLIKHDDGLSTIYAHLSLQTVKTGQRVSTGETIAYSGSTGAATGPHLHFGVFATQGLQVVKLTSKQSVKCYGSVIPVGATLDPALYL